MSAHIWRLAILAVVFAFYCWKFHERSTLFWLGVGWFICNFVAQGTVILMPVLFKLAASALVPSSQLIDAIVFGCDLVNKIAKLAIECLTVGIVVAIVRGRTKNQTA